ncbi:MAG: mucoidy inhibitor MuiA family protein, partial [Bacteroidota bacterium]
MDKLQLESKVTAVTVYTDRAMITRTAAGKIEAGATSVDLTNLPPNVLEDSVRISGEGTARILISDFKLRDQFLSEVPESKLRELLEAKKQLDAEIQALTDRVDVLNKQKSFIEGIGNKAIESVQEADEKHRMSMGEWKEMLEFLGQEMGNKNVDARELEKEIKEKKADLQQLNEQINRQKALTTRKRKLAEVDIEVREPGEFSFKISYLVYNANWVPMYDARVETDAQSVRIRYFGMVQQRTGENWEAVKVKLSTARPHIGGDPPTQSPWYLRMTPPPKPRSMARSRKKGGMMRSEDEGLDGMAEMVFEEEAYPSAPAGSAVAVGGAVYGHAQVAEGSGASVVFDTHGRSDVPGDGSKGKLLVMEEEFGNEFRYLTVPRLANHVYLTAEIENTTDFPLLP